MTKNYIILAHKNPHQIYRLITNLSDKDAHFFLHIDLKSNLSDFDILKSCNNTTIISERENCIWGDFSIVRATLHLIKKVTDSGNTGFTILLSGQDYPIKSKSIISNFLENHSNENFIEVINIEEKWKKKMVKDKVEHYHFLHSEKKSHSNSYAPFSHSSYKEKIRTITHIIKGRLSIKSFKIINKLPKRIPYFNKQYAGSQWWAFNSYTLSAINNYYEENSIKLTNYYRYTSSPDEIFFQSVLMHLKETDENIIVKPSLTYVNWTRKKCSLPVTFNDNDLQELKDIPHLFARKFDVDYNDEILDKIDKSLLQK